MTQFKVNPQLTQQISDIRENGEKMTEKLGVIPLGGLNTLPTAQAYADQHQAIKELVDLYFTLVNKDTADLDAMVAVAEAMDQALK